MRQLVLRSMFSLLEPSKGVKTSAWSQILSRPSEEPYVGQKCVKVILAIISIMSDMVNYLLLVQCLTLKCVAFVKFMSLTDVTYQFLSRYRMLG